MKNGISKKITALVTAIVVVALIALAGCAGKSSGDAPDGGAAPSAAESAGGVSDKAAPEATASAGGVSDKAAPDAVPNMSLEEFLGRMVVAVRVSEGSDGSFSAEFDSTEAESCPKNIVSNIMGFIGSDGKNLLEPDEGYFGGVNGEFVDWEAYGLSAPESIEAGSDPQQWSSKEMPLCNRAESSAVDWIAKNVFNCSDASLAVLVENLPTGEASRGFSQYLSGDCYYSIVGQIGGFPQGSLVSDVEQETVGDFTYVSWNATPCEFSGNGPSGIKHSARDEAARTCYAKVAMKTVDGVTFWSLYKLSTSPISAE